MERLWLQHNKKLVQQKRQAKQNEIINSIQQTKETKETFTEPFLELKGQEFPPVFNNTELYTNLEHTLASYERRSSKRTKQSTIERLKQSLKRNNSNIWN